MRFRKLEYPSLFRPPPGLSKKKNSVQRNSRRESRPSPEYLVSTLQLHLPSPFLLPLHEPSVREIAITHNPIPPIRYARRRRSYPSTDPISTCAPFAQSAGAQYSAGLWETPLRQGTKIMLVGQRRAVKTLSWPVGADGGGFDVS